MVQSRVEEEFCPFMRVVRSPSFKFSLENLKSHKLVSKAAENFPNICGKSWDESNSLARWDDVPKSRVVFLMISLATGLENPGILNFELSGSVSL